MLISDLHTIGNNLYKIRKSRGLTQAEAAEKAGLSDRTYADIERGGVSMRIDSLMRICSALNITPNDILVAEKPIEVTEEDVAAAMKGCGAKEKETALKLLGVYMNSLK